MARVAVLHNVLLLRVAQYTCFFSFLSCNFHCFVFIQYVRPHLIPENKIEIIGGRHPLKELVLDAFIPNDTVIAQTGGLDQEPIQLISGPNNSYLNI
jgi:DNA mismatch repair ATPase MutS